MTCADLPAIPLTKRSDFGDPGVPSPYGGAPRGTNGRYSWRRSTRGLRTVSDVAGAVRSILISRRTP